MDRENMAVLCLDYLAGSISPDSVEDLSQELRDDGEARREFARLLLLQVQLNELAPGHQDSLARLGVALYRPDYSAAPR